MFSRTDLVAFGICLLIALVAALAAYVIVDLSSREPDAASISRATAALAPARGGSSDTAPAWSR